jgi:hypothetical protein
LPNFLFLIGTGYGRAKKSIVTLLYDFMAVIQ